MYIPLKQSKELTYHNMTGGSTIGTFSNGIYDVNAVKTGLPFHVDPTPMKSPYPYFNVSPTTRGEGFGGTGSAVFSLFDAPAQTTPTPTQPVVLPPEPQGFPIMLVAGAAGALLIVASSCWLCSSLP